jgi:DNA-binding response OmpR family regulator
VVLADREAPWERLVGDLVLLRYQPFVRPERGSPVLVGPAPAVALILTEDVKHHAVPASEELRRTEAMRAVPILWLVDGSDLADLPANAHLLDEFLARPYQTAELGARLALLLHRSVDELDDVVRRGPLAEPPHLPGVARGRDARPHVHGVRAAEAPDGVPGPRVYTREEILSLVRGYDYFGGMRTVDVHVRHLRAKLGQDHAWLIETVRGVGYRFAQVRS